uniref:Uncharacterized protein n=1 Tax=Aegilops tauschii subsp. strangulata TaxID=200361 RepID=A0A453NPC4_AEGTS
MTSTLGISYTVSVAPIKVLIANRRPPPPPPRWAGPFSLFFFFFLLKPQKPARDELNPGSPLYFINY